MFSAAYQQAAVTSRRLLRQPNVAAVMPSAVAALYATCTGYGCSGANKISAESAASALPASIRANGARWPLSAPAASSRRYAVRKFVSSSTSRYTTVLIRPPPLFAAMLPLYAPVGEKIRGRWDVRKADKMNAFPTGEPNQTKTPRCKSQRGVKCYLCDFTWMRRRSSWRRKRNRGAHRPRCGQRTESTGQRRGGSGGKHRP